MSYYFVIVGTRDNPLYTADLASKPSTSSGPASFFSSASSTASGHLTPQSPTAQTEGVGSSGGGVGSIFGFGGALDALAGGLSSRGAAAGLSVRGSTKATGGADATDGKGIGFGRYNDKHVLQMIAHSSLDVVEDKQFANGAM